MALIHVLSISGRKHMIHHDLCFSEVNSESRADVLCCSLGSGAEAILHWMTTDPFNIYLASSGGHTRSRDMKKPTSLCKIFLNPSKL